MVAVIMGMTAFIPLVQLSCQDQAVLQHGTCHASEWASWREIVTLWGGCSTGHGYHQWPSFMRRSQQAAHISNLAANAAQYLQEGEQGIQVLLSTPNQ